MMSSLVKILLLTILLGFSPLDAKTSNAFQLDEVVPIVVIPSGKRAVKAVQTDEKKKAETEDNEQDVVDTSKLGPDKKEISNQFAQLHLRDGSVIGGEIKTSTIEVKTDYGILTIPISRVSKIYPGLNSRVELRDQLAKLVENLGAGDIAIRDAAQRDLIAMGLKIKNVLGKFEDGGVAERGKRLSEIQDALNELAEDPDDSDESLNPEAPLSYNDRIVTPDFSIVGEIQQKEFQVKSKFGQLKVQLGDIMLADRQISQGRSEVRKSITVGPMTFFQTKPQSTGIRVKKGDKIFVTADGIVQWTNWNNSSTPDGLTNRSNWQGINSGTLVARVGNDNTKCVKVGAKGNFVAKSSGTLFLGISMRDSYATNAGYTWTGNYKAKVRISPK